MSLAPTVSHCPLLGKGHRDIRLRTPPKAGHHALPLLQARNLLFGAYSRSSHSTAARRAGVVVKSAGTATYVGEWQLVVLCAAVTQMSSSRRAGAAAAADLEGTASFLAQTVYLVLLPCYAFMLGTAIDAWQPLMLGVIVGAVRAAIGTAAGLACARLVEQLCQGGIPVLSELWSRTSSSSAQQAIAQATAKAMGTPQAMSSLLPQRAAVPPGLRLALLLACAFPSAIMPASSALECSAPGFAQGVCLGLMLSLWLATQRILAWVVKSPSQGGPNDGSAVFQPLHTWVRLQGNQEVLVSRDDQPSSSGAAVNPGAAGDQASAATQAEGSGEVIEAVVRDLPSAPAGFKQLLSQGREGLGSGDRSGSGSYIERQQPGMPTRSAWQGSSGNGEDDAPSSSSSWTDAPWLHAATSRIEAFLPAAALLAGLAVRPLLHWQPDFSVLPWDGNLLLKLSSSFVGAVEGLVPALQMLLVLHLACLCIATEETMPGVPGAGIDAYGESKWLRLRGLLIPSQPSDILLLGLALLGHFLASAAAIRISELLGFLTSVPPSLQLVQPELATVVLVQMVRSKVGGFKLDAVRQLVVLLVRMVLWGPVITEASRWLLLKVQAAAVLRPL